MFDCALDAVYAIAECMSIVILWLCIESGFVSKAKYLFLAYLY